MNNQSDPLEPLRKNAEAWLSHNRSNPMTTQSIEQLLHELQVHQIELEMQNEELRRSQVALQESVDRFAEFYDFAPVGYLTLNHQGWISEINLTCADMLGLERVKCIHHRFTPLVVAENQDRWHTHFFRALKNDGNFSCYVKLKNSDGSYFDAQLDCQRRPGADNKFVVRVVVTQRKLDETQLLQSFHEIEDLYNHAPCGYHSLDGEGYFLRINDTELEWLGYTRQEVVGKMKFADFLLADGKIVFKEKFSQFLQDGFVHDLEFDLVRKDGTLFTGLLNATAIYDQNGNFLMSRSTVADITERKKMEVFKKSILNSVAPAIVVLNSHGEIVAVNQSWERFSVENSNEPGKTTPGTDIGSNYLSACQTTVKTEGEPDINREIQAVMEGRLSTFSLEYPCHSPHQQRWFRMNVTPLGEVVNEGVVITHTNITERKKAEQTQKKLTRAFKLLSDCGKLLIHADEEQKLLEMICQLTVETGGYLMAWVGFAENDADRSVRPIAQSGYEEGYLDNVQVTWSDTEMGQGPTGTAIRTGVKVVNLNCLANPKMKPWREAAIKRGYQSSIALPLVINHQAIGALTIYSAESNAFSNEESDLLEELASELAYGIQTLRTRIEHNEAMLALQQSEQRYHGMLADQTEVISRFNADYTVLYANDAFCRLFGKRNEELVGHIWNPVVVLEDLPLVKSKLDSLSPTHPVITLENRIIAAGGAIRWMQFVNRGFYDEQGKLLEIQSVGRDITERKELENALAANEKEFRLLAESIPQLVWITHPDGWNIYSNQRWLDYTGLSREESYGHSWTKILHPDDQIVALCAWQRALDHQVAYSHESRLRRADGTYRWWLVRGEPVKDEKENIYKWFGTCTDIHDMKVAEQELIVAAKIEHEIVAKNNQLTQEISRRNADLSALTAHVQKVAETERANLARELHDEVGSILTALSMEVGRLRSKASDPKLVEDLSTIKDLISQAAKIKSNIISQLYPTVLDDYGFFYALNWLAQEFKKYSGIAIELQVPQEVVVMDNPFALAAYRITQECLTNIAKHAGASKVDIKVEAREGFLYLSIHDNGKGLPKQISVNRHGIFGMIERARYLGGTMEIGSDDGNGTTAKLMVPLSVPNPPNIKRVLVADDHAIVRDAIRRLVDSQADDFVISGEAEDGKSAISMALEGVWDVMLLDINMPKKNGLKVLEAVKKNKPDLPVIILSSHAQEKYAEIALTKGAASYLEKDKTDQLIEEMRRVTKPDKS